MDMSHSVPCRKKWYRALVKTSTSRLWLAISNFRFFNYYLGVDQYRGTVWMLLSSKSGSLFRWTAAPFLRSFPDCDGSPAHHAGSSMDSSASVSSASVERAFWLDLVELDLGIGEVISRKSEKKKQKYIKKWWLFIWLVKVFWKKCIFSFTGYIFTNSQCLDRKTAMNIDSHR